MLLCGTGLLSLVQDLVAAVYRRWRHLALTALLLLVLVYVYAVLAFVFFRHLAVVDVADRGFVRCAPAIGKGKKGGGTLIFTLAIRALFFPSLPLVAARVKRVPRPPTWCRLPHPGAA